MNTAKKILRLSFIFLLIEIVITILVLISLRILFPHNKEILHSKTLKCYGKDISKDKDIEYCSNRDIFDFYNNNLIKDDDKHKLEIRQDTNGNILEKKYIEFDVQNNEIGSITLIFNLKHELLSYIERGSLGAERREYLYDINGNRTVMVQYLNESNIPEKVIYFEYPYQSSENIKRTVYDE